MMLDPDCQAVCFDMDGTLLDTKVDYGRMGALIFDAVRGAGVPEDLIDESLGYKLNVDRAISWMLANRGPSEIQALSDSISGTARDIEMERVDEARPFPGVPEMLSSLRGAGYRIGVLTRGCREYAEAALRISGVMEYVDALVARDDHPESEAKPSPVAMRHMSEAIGVPCGRITYVGDHKMDWMCARDSSAKFVAVTSGTFTYEDWVAQSDELVILETCAGISDMIPPGRL